MVLQQQRELLQVVVAIQVGPGEGGFKPAWACDEAITQLRGVDGFLQFARNCFGVDAHEWVARPDMAGQGLASHIALHGRAQMDDLLAVDLLDLRQRLSSVAVAGGGDKAG